MLYEDSSGRLFTQDEVDELFEYEIEELGIHVYNEEAEA
jgi:hypothetical protein